MSSTGFDAPQLPHATSIAGQDEITARLVGDYRSIRAIWGQCDSRYAYRNIIETFRFTGACLTVLLYDWGAHSSIICVLSVLTRS